MPATTTDRAAGGVDGHGAQGQQRGILGPGQRDERFAQQMQPPAERLGLAGRRGVADEDRVGDGGREIIALGRASMSRAVRHPLMTVLLRSSALGAGGAAVDEPTHEQIDDVLAQLFHACPSSRQFLEARAGASRSTCGAPAPTRTGLAPARRTRVLPVVTASLPVKRC